VTSAGTKLRLLREQLGYTLRDVEQSSMRIAEQLKNEEYGIPLSRLSDVETKAVVPSVYRMYTLSSVYRLDFYELLSWYGIDLSSITKHSSPMMRRTHRHEPVESEKIKVPVRFDPSFDLRRTCDLGRMISDWGLVPLPELKALAEDDYTYGYIGSEDYTMYPLLMPGTFIQVDEEKHHVLEGVWRSEYERPIYFVETREGHICSWCSVKGDCLILQPHPLSPMPVRILRNKQDAEVIGQVVGIAMRLGQFSAPSVRPPENKVPAKLT